MKKHIANLTKELFPTGVASQVLGAMFSLPPATCKVKRQLNVDITAKDGIQLKTDIYAPQGSGPFPTLLMRTPYGRLGYGTVAEVYAERGFRTLLQACRGTDGSGGEFDPLVNERDDGIATLNWIKQQRWYDGRLGLTGPSYLGYTQWAICDELPPTAALCAYATSSNFEKSVFPGGTFALQLWLSWLQTIHGLDNDLIKVSLRIAVGDIERRTKKTSLTIPLSEADVATVGEIIPFWRQWFDNSIDNREFWAPRNHRSRLNKNTPPNCFVTGWYDLMLDHHIADYTHLVEKGHRPQLTIGRWFHTEQDLLGEGLKQTIGWMNAHLLGDKNAIRKSPVRIYISGTEIWHECEIFPPENVTKFSLYLGKQNALLSASPNENASTTYQYDPADPTPNVGGAIFAFAGAGARNNAELEARADVLVFTSERLTQDMTMIGNPYANLFVKSSLAHTDFFVRLCDVTSGGKSTNICDAIIRLTPQNTLADKDGVVALEIKLHASAHTFLKGHRMRLQVSSGAHPRFARNLGTNEPIGSATNMRTADQEVLFGPYFPSAITIPVVDLP